MNIKIMVAAHKPYWMPEDPVYLPVQVGAAGKNSLGFQRDDEGENISDKNPYYCELTGLYWAWKNLQADYLGLVHYRRYFSKSLFGDKKQRILNQKDIEQKLQETGIILPKPRHYWIETNYSQYIHAHHAEDLDLTRGIIQEKHPEYLLAFDQSMNKRSGHRFNMFIMKKDLLQEYCTWLFDILFELEKRLDITSYSKNDQRVFGFVGERLMDVWLETKQLKYTDCSYVFLENQNWLVKGGNFLKRWFNGSRSQKDE